MTERKKNINIILDMSMSMKTCIGAVCLFLEEMDKRLRRIGNLEFSIQLTWFASEISSTVTFENGRPETRDPVEFFGALRKLSLCRGRQMTSEDDVEAGLKTAFSNMEGEDCEQVLLVFSDYRPKREIRLDRERGVNRVFLFVPEDSHAGYHFRMTGENGNPQIAMPVIQWPLETLMQSWTDSMWSCLTGYMGIIEE